MDVAYSRVLFLGTAGVGKTSFKRSLMKLPWECNTTSTVVSDISQVRPFTHKWHTFKDQWRAVSHEDEIEELAGLILAVYKKELKGSNATAYAHDESSQSVPETHSNIIDKVEKIVSDALSYIKRNPTSPLKPQPFLHFWDCGGQPPFIEILPVFLTSRTLFFLVFDAEKDLKSNWKSVINIERERVDQEEVHMTTLDYMLNWMANIHGYRRPTEQEKVWFKDTNQQKNPPVDPTDVFQSHFAKLCDIISSDVVKVCNECNSCQLIGHETRSFVITAKGASDHDKATRLLYDIELQLKSCINKQEYLSNVIEAFLRVNNSNLNYGYNMEESGSEKSTREKKDISFVSYQELILTNSNNRKMLTFLLKKKYYVILTV
uniref:C-terminal of Roc (COR) domain-containing protein n=1 Tax=Amphimedon queenslandica TaxID=400682 RepID=A0A1X7T856_AMPQE